MLANSGCYLAHVTAGQVRLLRASRPIAEVLGDPDTPDAVRERLELVRRAKTFATGLGLDVDGQYTSYAAWPGDRVITAVVATRPGEVEPAGFFFPILGRLPYKGYFDPRRAGGEAERLRGRGLDVCKVRVAAYSTLGWFDDPITGPMLQVEEGRLVETVVHELVHATVFVRGHPTFNESVASFIGQEARVRFFAEAGDAERAADERRRVTDRRRVRAQVLAFRRRVQALYEAEPPGPERDAAREDLEAEARAALAALPLARLDPQAVAAAARLNDACLALDKTYASDRERYAELLEALGGDLRAFVARVRRAADASDPVAALFSV